MPKIRVTKHGGFKYGVGADRKQYGLGKELIVKQKDARMLVAAKLAEVVDDGQKAETKAPRAARTAVRTTAKAPARKAATRAQSTAASKYNRRDMRAK